MVHTQEETPIFGLVEDSPEVRLQKFNLTMGLRDHEAQWKGLRVASDQEARDAIRLVEPGGFRIGRLRSYLKRLLGKWI